MVWWRTYRLIKKSSYIFEKSIVIALASSLSLILLIYWFNHLLACQLRFVMTLLLYVVLRMHEQLLTCMQIKNRNQLAVQLLVSVWYNTFEYWLKYVDLLTSKSPDKKTLTSACSYGVCHIRWEVGFTIEFENLWYNTLAS